ncbi:MAG: type II CAAX endopeptidase family protein [Leptolyngbyaceae cyanobacterium MO_188.B28]|nr:type II CAAX endopeptidase family protein [Leptolyngbyaceae cyanobacterium MO_188.B28]
MSNPFLRLRVRTLFLVVFINLLCGLFLVVLASLGILPLAPEDPALALIQSVLIVSSLCLWVVWRCRYLHIYQRYLVGTIPQGFPWTKTVFLIGAVLIFSQGAAQISYHLLSFLYPSLVQSILQEDLLRSAQSTLTPLYRVLMLFTILVVLPIAEEFLFRGILIHRWGTKWGIPRAIVFSSVLFGILHTNLLGLSVFGLVMALLYLKTRTLLIPIICHLLNNLLAIALGFLPPLTDSVETIDTLAELQANWWMGLLCIAISAPFVMRFIYQNWPRPEACLPYFANSGTTQAW